MSTLIIAEAGVNHNGDMDTAKQLINCASDAGANLVKFQTYNTEKLVTVDAAKADYQSKNDATVESQSSMLQRLQLTKDMHYELVEHCATKNIGFFSTGFDLESLDFLHQIGQEIYKVPSGEITNLPYLRHISNLAQQIIVSTGMSTLADVEVAIDVLTSNGMLRDNITVLHCTSEYPTAMSDVNLRVMRNLKNTFGVKVGYSDHTKGIEVAIAATALGASVIEKHFTLDQTQEGPDHAASLEPAELGRMVAAIRNIEVALGTGVKTLSAGEKANRAVARKSIVAGRHIKLGELFSVDNLEVKRPAHGISPMQWDEVLGCTARKAFKKDEPITL